MKTILIATDFSNAAENASLYAVELADIFNARIILFSAYMQVPFAIPEAPVMITQEEVHMQVETQLVDTAEILGRHRPVSIETCSKTGTATHSILEAIKEYHPDLVIAGMKKDGKQFRRLFGSTVTQLIRKIPVPLLVVPEDAKFANIDTIALATESDLPPDADPHVLDAMREIAERFHSKLYLARVVDSRFTEAYEVLHRPTHLSHMIRTLDPEFKCIEGEEIAETLVRFIKRQHIDILAMMPHKYSMLERWFISSVTRYMAFITSIPMLVLPEKHIN